MLTYEVPGELADDAQVGVRVIVPLGRRRITGLIAERVQTAPAGIRTRPLLSVLDREPVVPTELLELAKWMSEYYLTPFSEVLSLAIGRGLTTSSERHVHLIDPAKAASERERRIVDALGEAGGTLEVARLTKRLGAGSLADVLRALADAKAISFEERLPEPQVHARFESAVTLLEEADQAMVETLFAHAPRRREVYEYLLSLPSRQARLTDLQALFPNPTSQINALVKAGLVERKKLEAYRTLDLDSGPDTPVELSADQQAAHVGISAALGCYRAFLLHGVTSSGKTEVYLRVIAEVLRRNETALILVPEIPLTHQVVGRLVARFGRNVAVLHSELSSGERWDQWRRIARGQARIAVGARSAVLAPMQNLGLIVVDEEHDSSYKQGDGVRYHGRDVAVVRARHAGCPVVLGSATPSIESWHNACGGTYRLIFMPSRVAGAELPSMEVVDLRERDIVATGGLSRYLATQLKRNFDEGGQTLLFLNRRGLAPALFCYACGEAVVCTNCSVAMTLHKGGDRLRCHYCDASRARPPLCPSCSQDALVAQGLGTQRVEQAVTRLLPAARVARLDRDVTTRKGASAQLLRTWRAGELDVLVGTQMIAKGHDAHGVTLVGVIQADLSIAVPDFRAGERTFQLLAQVAGRAGRGSRRGRVVIQSYQPEHYAIADAAHHDFEAFAKLETREREELSYPPYARMAIVRFEGPTAKAALDLAENAAEIVKAYARKYDGPVLRGPAPAPMERLRGRYRFLLQLRHSRSGIVRGAAQAVARRLRAKARKARVRLLVDIDPIEML